MKQLGMLTYDNAGFDDAALEIAHQFNELRRANKTIEYKDIHITRGMLGRFWVVLVYEYDDTAFGQPESEPELLNIETGKYDKPKYMGMPAELDPNDPDWREKLEAHRKLQGTT